MSPSNLRLSGPIGWLVAGVGIVVLVAASALLIRSCNGDTTSEAPGDSTPPRLVLNVTNVEAGESWEFTRDAHVTVRDEEPLNIVLKAFAPGGIHRLELGEEGNWTCHSGHLGARRSTLAVPDVSVFSASPPHTNRLLFHRTSFVGWACPSGFGNPTGSFVIQGEGENFAGGQLGTRRITLVVCNERGCTD
jgi:hypothetical protein